MKERRIYKQKNGQFVITWKANVYLQPPEFKPAEHQTLVLVSPSADDAVLTDDTGQQWTLVGENPGCGVRCPADFRQWKGAEVAELIPGLSSEVCAKLQAYGHTEALASVWKHLTHAERRQVVACLEAPPSKPSES